jgi:hypothetical protein
MTPLARTGTVPEFFVSALDHIEIMGSVSRHVWVTERTVGSKVIYMPAVNLIMPNCIVSDGILKQTRAMAIALIGFEEHPLN